MKILENLDPRGKSKNPRSKNPRMEVLEIRPWEVQESKIQEWKSWKSGTPEAPILPYYHTRGQKPLKNSPGTILGDHTRGPYDTTILEGETSEKLSGDHTRGPYKGTIRYYHGIGEKQ